MPGTSWTEQSVALQGWQSGIVAPGATAQTILFGSMLIGGAGLSAPLASTWTEASVAATTHTEVSVAATSWTEGSL